jgi:hypothetical protein
MTDVELERCRTWYEAAYESAGFGAQRNYPNEELFDLLRVWMTPA